MVSKGKLRTFIIEWCHWDIFNGKIPEGGAAHVHAEKSVAMLLQRYQKVSYVYVYVYMSGATESRIDFFNERFQKEVHVYILRKV